MTSLLFVLNPREMRECLEAIENLPIEKCWLSYMTEVHAAEHFNALVRHTSFDRYLIVSDDASPSPECLAAVLDLHDQHGDVATGYSNIDEVLPLVNVTRNHLPAPPPTMGSYDLLTQAEVDAIEGPFRTTFAGFSLTCMSRDAWLRFPMQPTELGGQMDYQLSWRLQEAGIPIVTRREAWMRHHKQTWSRGDSTPGRQLLVGLRNPEVTWT